MNELLEALVQAERSRSLAPEAPERFSVPYDVSDWVPKAMLRDWVIEAINTLDWSSPELGELLRHHPGFEPRALLGTLTLGYLTGSFGAEEIAHAAAADPEFRLLRPKTPPLPEEVSQFRRLNRGLLKWAIAEVLNKVVKAQFVEGVQFPRLPPGLRRYVVENAIERLNIARHFDRGAEA